MFGCCDARRGPRLVDEARGELRIAREVAPEDLHGEAPVERDVADLVDLTHAAFAEQREDLVAAVDVLADERIAGPTSSTPRSSFVPSKGQNAASAEKRCPQRRAPP